MIVDASVLLRAYFPDEAQPQAQVMIREHVAGRVRLKAPMLLLYEISNAVWQAERRKRISQRQAEEILKSFGDLKIELATQTWGEIVPMARRYNLSAYDASYLCLAEKLGESFITGDERLFEAVHPNLDWVMRLGE